MCCFYRPTHSITSAGLQAYTDVSSQLAEAELAAAQLRQQLAASSGVVEELASAKAQCEGLQARCADLEQAVAGARQQAAAAQAEANVARAQAAASAAAAAVMGSPSMIRATPAATPAATPGAARGVPSSVSQSSSVAELLERVAELEQEAALAVAASNRATAEKDALERELALKCVLVPLFMVWVLWHASLLCDAGGVRV